MERFIFTPTNFHIGESCFLWVKMVPKLGLKNPAIKSNLLLYFHISYINDKEFLFNFLCICMHT
jgi:hypothetical protein